MTLSNVEKALGSLVSALSNDNYEQVLARYRLWLEIEQTHSQSISDLIFDTVRKNRRTKFSSSTLIYPSASLVIRFADDIEADRTFASHSAGLRNRLCADVLRDFFHGDLGIAYYNLTSTEFHKDANLIAYCVNLGHIEEATIRNHILQQLISHRKLFEHQAEALYILFKIAGATFCAYTCPETVDSCFERLTGCWRDNSERKVLLQELIRLRESGWQGLPSPPVFTTGRSARSGTDQNDPSTTPVATTLGLPNTDLEPHIPQSPPLESVVAPEVGTIPASPATRSPSISIATLSDFTTADISDDEPPIDPTAITPHETFNFEDGNVEVLCGNTLFLVHSTILSLHSPALRRMLAQTTLATAESPNGCPRIQTLDTAADFAALLKVIYLPRFPERNIAPDFSTFSSLLRMSTKYEMPAVRSHLLDLVRDAYPETFEGVTPTRQLGEKVFTGPTPHPNEVLNLFIQQNLTSALPLAYYMVARRGVDSLMDGRLPQSATLSPEVLRSATKGLMELRGIELNETHNLILESKSPRLCCSASCPSRKTTGPGVSDAHRKVIDRITASPRSGTKVLEVLSLSGVCGGDSAGFCESCVKRWEAGHAEVRKRAWDMLPNAFGLKS